jgi:hypothetical protein
MQGLPCLKQKMCIAYMIGSRLTMANFFSIFLGATGDIPIFAIRKKGV